MNRRDFVAATVLLGVSQHVPFKAAAQTEVQSKKLIIEVRLNEYRKRGSNPHIPYSNEEVINDAIECGKAGASIIHFHARKSQGEPEYGYQAYHDIVKGIRESSDLLIHPTLGAGSNDASAEARLQNVLKLVEDKLSPDIIPVEPGSTNIDRFDPDKKDFETDNRIYTISTASQKYLLEQARKMRVKPYLQCFNVSTLRQVNALALSQRLDQPLLLSFQLTEGGMLYGHPATPRGLLSYLDFLPQNIRCEWFVLDIGGNLLELAAVIIQLGGHLSIGLGDYDFRELGAPTNAELVATCVQISRQCGRALATPEEARQLLGISIEKE